MPEQDNSSILPIIVLRSNDICFLGILRSFHAAGIPTVAVTFDWPDAGPWYSNHSAGLGKEYRIPNPYTHATEAVASLKEILGTLHRQYAGRLLAIPSSDTNLMFLLDNYGEFEDDIILMGHRDFAWPRGDVVNKYECAKLLCKNLPGQVPVTERCASPDDIERVVDEMVFPAVYKPVVKDYGQTFYRAHGGNKAIECTDSETLRKSLIREMEAGFDLVVQEKLEFDSAYDEIPFYLYADADHNITMAANGIKELIEPHPFGTAIILRFAWLPELLDLARLVVRALEYRGILMIEFARDRRDGVWKVVEINPRHWLFNGFYQRLGLNYSAQLGLDRCGELGSDLVCADDELLARNPVHVDLWALATVWQREEGGLTFARYMERLDGIEGSLSSAFYDPADPGPGERRIADMLDSFQWPHKGAQDIIKLLQF